MLDPRRRRAPCTLRTARECRWGTAAAGGVAAFVADWEAAEGRRQPPQKRTERWPAFDVLGQLTEPALPRGERRLRVPFVRRRVLRGSWTCS